jgi:Sigma-70, region 4
MSQRVKDLLDEAAAGIEPRSTDPVAAVVRRGRAARARAVAAGGLAVVAVLTGGTVAGAKLVDDPPPAAVIETAAAPRPATRPDRPPNPRLDKGRIVAGDVSVAVPQGWQALPIEEASCGLQSKTVLLGEGGNPWGPYTRRVMVRAAWRAGRRLWRRELPTQAPPDRAGADPYDGADTAQLVLQALRTLPAQQRVVLVLRYWGGLSEQEIAAELGCSVGTVKSRAHRAVAALRRLDGPLAEAFVTAYIR